METKLTDERITIRRFRSEDVFLLYDAARESIETVYEWLPWCHPKYSLEDSSSYVLSRDEAWRKKEEYSFAIVDARTDRFLGGVAINGINPLHRVANLGYWVRKNHTGRGTATAATLLAARFGFDALGLQRIEIVAAVGNVASQRVAEKAGAKREGVLRKRLLLNGQVHAAVLFSLVAEDLET